MVGWSRLHTTSGPSPSRSPFPQSGQHLHPHGSFRASSSSRTPHADPDRSLAGALRDGLRRAGCEVFTDEIELGVDASERRDLAASGYFILLLSARSVHSEMVCEEARLAHARRKAEGMPRLLPVRVAYTGPLGSLWDHGSTRTSG